MNLRCDIFGFQKSNLYKGHKIITKSVSQLMMSVS